MTAQKNAIVTGANAGLGFAVCKHLAKLNYRILMACRDLEKGMQAKREILKQHPDTVIDVLELDLSKQKSVLAFANLVKQDYQHLDLLINNAGVMMTPYSVTADGFEYQLATNYLGHFALTGYLLPLLSATARSRVVNLSSLAHKWSGIRFNDPNFQTGYNEKAAYGQSKLACLMFSYELDRRLKASGSSAIATAAHPGISNTNLFKSNPGFLRWLSPVVGQSVESGGKPILYAALSEKLVGGEYIGPDGFKEWRGEPTIVNSSDESKNMEDAKKLWALSEKLTGVTYQF